MDHYGVSASSFADYMGVGRSSISHILSGRNKPSLDFVMKITEAYGDVDMQWLLYGKGSFPKSEEIVQEKQLVTATPLQEKIQPTTLPIDKEDQDLFSQHTPAPVQENETPTPIPQTSQEAIRKITYDEEKIERIVIFYNDGSFRSYTTKKS
ncbi:Helix-turn-helix [Aquimarina spongiae]|uniref:Helix-turn-helix n=2 Tax=Aquimarina spongiae TaxID=570521 RepID=A0A1M6ALL8_9FLAO|nr:Helix-turn-helix [Aquimarina spongiae]